MQPLVQNRPIPESKENFVRVIAVKGGEMAGTWEFRKDAVTIGRGASADVRLEGKNISRLHTTLVIRDGAIYVKDAGSLNGSWVNGSRVSEAPITARDIVHVGGFRLKAFFTAEPAEPSISGSRVQLHAVPSAESAAGSDPTAPQMELPTPEGPARQAFSKALSESLPLRQQPEADLEQENTPEQTPADETAPRNAPAARLSPKPAPPVAKQTAVPPPPAPATIPASLKATTPAKPGARSLKKPVMDARRFPAAPAKSTGKRPFSTYVAIAFGLMLAGMVVTVTLVNAALLFMSAGF